MNSHGAWSQHELGEGVGGKTNICLRGRHEDLHRHLYMIFSNNMLLKSVNPLIGSVVIVPHVYVENKTR